MFNAKIVKGRKRGHENRNCLKIIVSYIQAGVSSLPVVASLFQTIIDLFSATSVYFAGHSPILKGVEKLIDKRRKKNYFSFFILANEQEYFRNFLLNTILY